jgi:hypothetical protein
VSTAAKEAETETNNCMDKSNAKRLCLRFIICLLCYV